MGCSILGSLSEANRTLGFYKEGIQQAREGLEIYQRLGNTVEQASCLYYLAGLLHRDKQLSAAKEAASQATDLLLETGERFLTCQSQRLLGNIYRSEGDGEKAIHHLEAALAIASLFEWRAQLFWIHHSLGILFLDQCEFDSAHLHAGQAKSHAVENAYYLGRAIYLRAIILYRQCRFEEAKFQALCASGAYEKLGAAKDLEACRALLQKIDRDVRSQSASNNSDSNGEILGRMSLPTPFSLPS